MKDLNIENCPDKNYYVEFLVLKNFIAAIKRHGMYSKFRSTVGIETNNCVSTMYKKMRCFQPVIQNRSKENAFVKAENIGSFLRIMVKTFGGKCGSDFQNNQDGMLQRHIANCTNMLIHVFVERYNNDFAFLSEIGGEIFNSTCEEIFGVGFVDMTQPRPEEMEKMKQIHELIKAGKLPELPPNMAEQINRMMEENHGMYGDGFMEDMEDEYYDDEDTYYDEDYDEDRDEEWADEEAVDEAPGF